MDTIPKQCELKPYKYRNEVEVPSLGFVDDLANIHECGESTRILHEYTKNQK